MTFPNCSAASRCSSAARTSASGYTLSTIGLTPSSISRKTSSNSPELPIVDPRMSACLKKTRGQSSVTLGPLVEPQVTILPPGARAFRSSSMVAAPTESKITSAPFLPVDSRTGPEKPSVGKASSAPSRREWSSFASERLVAITLAPRCLPIAIAATLTPAPAPTTSSVSPLCRRARVVSIR